MSWPNFLAPAWGWMGLLALPLIALYLLRQKRPDMAVSSTLLWSKALADMREYAVSEVAAESAVVIAASDSRGTGDRTDAAGDSGERGRKQGGGDSY